MSLLEEYFQLYTNRTVIAMILILIGVAIVLYIIKKINEALEPSQEEGKKEDETEVPMPNWSQQDFKNFQRRDLVDHYAFHYRFTLYFPKGTAIYRDKFAYDVRDEKELQQCFVDMFKRQADCSPDGTTLFVYRDIPNIRNMMDIMLEDLRDMAQLRSRSGAYGYAPFAGMHMLRTIELPALDHHKVEGMDDEPFRRSLDLSLTLLSTDFTEPFYLKYKFTPRALSPPPAPPSVAAAEEEEQQTATNLEVQEEEENEEDAEELKSENEEEEDEEKERNVSEVQQVDEISE